MFYFKLLYYICLLYTSIDVEIAVVREEIVETNKRCEQHDQDLQRTRDEVDSRLNTMEEVTEARIESLKRTNQDEIKRVRLDAVSYTHLDVYKRQGLPLYG